MSLPSTIHAIWQRWSIPLSLLSRPPIPPTAPKPTSTNLPILGDPGFFRRRWDWWLRCTSASPTGHFTYNIGRNTAVGVSGIAGRKFFFESKDLGLSEGYAVLFGQAPSYNQETELEDGFDKWFSGRLTEMLRPQTLARTLPIMMRDVRGVMDRIATENKDGLCDPYDVIYKLVFLVNMRTVGCKEIADDPKLLRQVLHFYEMIEESATATGIVFPWLLTPAKIRRTYAGARLYMIFNGIARERRRLEKEVDDPLQVLLNRGDSIEKIIAVCWRNSLFCYDQGKYSKANIYTSS